jgi:hypothetical protein
VLIILDTIATVLAVVYAMATFAENSSSADITGYAVTLGVTILLVQLVVLPLGFAILASARAGRPIWPIIVFAAVMAPAAAYVEVALGLMSVDTSSFQGQYVLGAGCIFVVMVSIAAAMTRIRRQTRSVPFVPTGLR